MEFEDIIVLEEYYSTKRVNTKNLKLKLDKIIIQSGSSFVEIIALLNFTETRRVSFSLFSASYYSWKYLLKWSQKDYYYHHMYIPEPAILIHLSIEVILYDEMTLLTIPFLVPWQAETKSEKSILHSKMSKYVNIIPMSTCPKYV